jgi:hypothetical protein
LEKMSAGRAHLRTYASARRETTDGTSTNDRINHPRRNAPMTTKATSAKVLGARTLLLNGRAMGCEIISHGQQHT